MERASRWEASASCVPTCAGVSYAKAVALPQGMVLGPHTGI